MTTRRAKSDDAPPKLNTCGTFTGVCQNENQSRSNRQGAGMSLHIEGRRWFRKSYGNTYSRCYVYAHGALVYTSPVSGGYGDQYIEFALEWLRDSPDAMQYITPDQRDALDVRYNNGCYEWHGTRALRELLGASHSCIDVPRERDL